MSFLTRFLGGGQDRARARGLELLEEGRTSEALEHLRAAVAADSGSPANSLAGFHFRQALLQEGRRHLRAGRWGEAEPLLAEAVEHWDRYPDLHALLGAARGLGGDWDGGLAGARAALRVNPDYVEARLLEAAGLASLDRGREAAASLDALVESGRRVGHWLIDRLSEGAPHAPDRLPTDLVDLVTRTLAGASEKEELAAAVALCRAGRWPEGLERFADLVRKQPRYPDYRTRLAAALFQVGRNDEALAETEAALALNEDYRAAQDLRGLVLADLGRVAEARAFLADADERRGGSDRENEHGELFGAYLRAVTALLTGDHAGVPRALSGWGDLVRQFARAEVVLAAADDLAGRTAAAGDRLDALREEWPAEAVFAFLAACHHLREGDHEAVEKALAAWPDEGRGPDVRPLYLQGCLAADRGVAPDGAGTGVEAKPSTQGEPTVGPEAWRLLTARGALLSGDAAACAETCADLAARAVIVPDAVHLLTCAAMRSADAVPAGWIPQPSESAAALAATYHALVTVGRDAEAERRAATWRGLQPESPVGWWLSREFWLAPVRGWIA